MADNVLRKSIVVRMLLIGGLCILLLIPSTFIMVLISEREDTRNDAVMEVSDKWGAAQTVVGPILNIPLRNDSRIVHIMPDQIDFTVDVQPEIRYRGMFEIVLFSSQIRMEGRFAAVDVSELDIPEGSLQWDRAFVTLGISDLRGIRDTMVLKVDGREVPADPGVISTDVIQSGIHMFTSVQAPVKEMNFSSTIHLEGTGELLFVPVGKQTTVHIESPWDAPSFVGSSLPVKRSVNDGAFTAEWNVLHLNRNFPQIWAGKQYDVAQSAFGVRLLLPVDEYQKTMRAAKYAIMFIVFTFLAFFLTEILSKKTIHPIQYALIGFALLVFYVLLLSIGEQTSFDTAYALSSVSVILLIAGYTRSVIKSIVATGMITGILLLLYGFMFVLLQLEDYALLLGSIGLFFILGLVMYLTRKIDWFALGTREQNP